MKREVLAIMLGLSLMLSLVSPMNTAIAAAVITLNPETGSGGTSVSVSGSGFAASSTGTVWFDSNNDGTVSSGEPSVSVTTSSTGGFTESIVVPSVAPGLYLIKADVPSGGTIEASALFLVFIDLAPILNDVDPTFMDPTKSKKSVDVGEFPFGIECGDQNFVYVTVHDQGALIKIDKNTRQPVAIFDQPDEQVESGQNFYSVERDPNTGHLFMNERDSGELWRFKPGEPIATAWTRIPIVQEIVDSNAANGLDDVVYPETYAVRPARVQFPLTGNEYFFAIPSFGEVVFANNKIWVALKYTLDFTNPSDELEAGGDKSFAGLVKVDPVTLAVERIQILGADTPTGLVVDSSNPFIIWVSDQAAGKVFRFDTSTGTSVPIDLDSVLGPGSNPRGLATDNDNVYVALNKPGIDTSGDGIPDNKSQIAVIDKLTLTLKDQDPSDPDIDPIDTGAQILDTSFSGTFTVFVAEDENEGNELIWTDQSFHVGTINVLTGVKSFITTETFNNHFGCIPFDGEFWFAALGSAKVGILPNSKFSVGGIKRPTGTGGSDPTARSEGSPFGGLGSSNYDDQPPSIEEVLTSPGSLKVSAKITDNVGVKDVSLVVGKDLYPMKRRDGSPFWWEVTITASGTVSFKVVARDYNKNIAEYSGTAETSAGGSETPREGASLMVTPSSPASHSEPNYSIFATAVQPGDATAQLRPQITIKNTTNEPLKNIRLALSSELKGKFLLSDYAIKSIDPNSDVTVSLKLNGNPNVNVMKEPIPYEGQIFVTIDNHSPIVLKLSGTIPNESASLQSLFMKMIGSKAEQRYKSFEQPEQRISSDADYEVKLGSGASVIKSASDELIITNTGETPLKNLRIMASSLSDHFLPDQKNIALIPAGSFIKIKLVSHMNNAESPRDLQGELLIVPENGAPVTIPIDIEKRLLPDKNLMYEVRTLSGNDAISHTADGIVIRNNSEESIDSVRIILPRELARVLSISADSFKFIEPNSEKIVYLQPRGLDGNVKQILNDYTGQIIIVSSDGMKKVLPVNIVWKGMSSEHFVIYARDDADELMKAAQVINFLERSYQEVTSIMDEPSKKTVVYMTTSLDELKMLSNALAPSTYIYDQDVGFVWSNSEDINMLALREFTYRTIMQSYASYWTKQKIAMDNGNWLVDGVSNYVAARIVGERGMIMEQLDAFIAQPAPFEWYGAATPSQYGASYTLFKFLVQKYGDGIIDKTLSYLGSTMVSNHRCDTLEQCALLRAVYDANGLNINDKRNELNFAKIVQEWEEYVHNNYS